jgi:hypothetical protein
MKRFPDTPSPCIHFNGILQDTCKAGVNYSDIAGDEAGRALRLSCCRPFPGREDVVKVTCAKQRPQTEEEFRAQQAETDRNVEQVLGVSAAVHQWEEANGGPLIGQQRVMPCPVCGCSTLGIYRIPTRLYVACTTPECVRYEANLGGSVFDPTT